MPEMSEGEKREKIKRLLRENSMIRGVDFFQFAPGEMESFTCPICGAECDMERNVVRQGLAYAMHGFAGTHDEFRCPHRAEDAHTQAEEIFIMVKVQVLRNRKPDLS